VMNAKRPRASVERCIAKNLISTNHKHFIDGNLFGLAVEREIETVGQHRLQHGAEHRGLQGGVFPLGQVGLRDLGVDVVTD
jgi:hypothetical protein